MLQLININASNILSGKRHLSGLNICSETLKIHLFVISKFLTISSNCGLWLSASNHSSVQLLIWNDINSDANILQSCICLLDQLSMVNKTSQVLLSFFTSRLIWWITVDMLVISVVERYFRLGLKYLILLKES